MSRAGQGQLLAKYRPAPILLGPGCKGGVSMRRCCWAYHPHIRAWLCLAAPQGSIIPLALRAPMRRCATSRVMDASFTT